MRSVARSLYDSRTSCWPIFRTGKLRMMLQRTWHCRDRRFRAAPSWPPRLHMQLMAVWLLDRVLLANLTRHQSRGGRLILVQRWTWVVYASPTMATSILVGQLHQTSNSFASLFLEKSTSPCRYYFSCSVDVFLSATVSTHLRNLMKFRQN